MIKQILKTTSTLLIAILCVVLTLPAPTLAQLEVITVPGSVTITLNGSVTRVNNPWSLQPGIFPGDTWNTGASNISELAAIMSYLFSNNYLFNEDFTNANFTAAKIDEYRKNLWDFYNNTTLKPRVEIYTNGSGALPGETIQLTAMPIGFNSPMQEMYFLWSYAEEGQGTGSGTETSLQGQLAGAFTMPGQNVPREKWDLKHFGTAGPALDDPDNDGYVYEDEAVEDDRGLDYEGRVLPALQALGVDPESVNNDQEYTLGTDPNNTDTDNDGYKDGADLAGLGQHTLYFTIPEEAALGTGYNITLQAFGLSTVPAIAESTTGGVITGGTGDAFDPSSSAYTPAVATRTVKVSVDEGKPLDVSLSVLSIDPSTKETSANQVFAGDLVTVSATTENNTLPSDSLNYFWTVSDAGGTPAQQSNDSSDGRGRDFVTFAIPEDQGDAGAAYNVSVVVEEQPSTPFVSENEREITRATRPIKAGRSELTFSVLPRGELEVMYPPVVGFETAVKLTYRDNANVPIANPDYVWYIDGKKITYDADFENNKFNVISSPEHQILVFKVREKDTQVVLKVVNPAEPAKFIEFKKIVTAQDPQIRLYVDSDDGTANYTSIDRGETVSVTAEPLNYYYGDHFINYLGGDETALELRNGQTPESSSGGFTYYWTVNGVPIDARAHAAMSEEELRNFEKLTRIKNFNILQIGPNNLFPPQLLEAISFTNNSEFPTQIPVTVRLENYLPDESFPYEKFVQATDKIVLNTSPGDIFSGPSGNQPTARSDSILSTLLATAGVQISATMSFFSRVTLSILALIMIAYSLTLLIRPRYGVVLDQKKLHKLIN